MTSNLKKIVPRTATAAASPFDLPIGRSEIAFPNVAAIEDLVQEGARRSDKGSTMARLNQHRRQGPHNVERLSAARHAVLRRG